MSIDLAALGDVEACEILGVCIGTLSPGRVEDGIRLLTIASDAGSGIAAHNLGTLLISIDKERSKQAYARAYELGVEQQICSDPRWWERIKSS